MAPSSTLLAGALAVFCIGAAQASPRSIVGEWAATPGDCGTPAAYLVGPMSWTEDTLSCTFRSVVRQGDTVRWEGRCDGGNGASPESVVASLDGERLAARFVRGGGSVGGLRRCPRR